MPRIESTLYEREGHAGGGMDPPRAAVAQLRSKAAKWMLLNSDCDTSTTIRSQLARHVCENVDRQ